MDIKKVLPEKKKKKPFHGHEKEQTSCWLMVVCFHLAALLLMDLFSLFFLISIHINTHLAASLIFLDKAQNGDVKEA